jgi:hypothetical protein
MLYGVHVDRLHSRATSAPVTVIGIDCATKAERIGLARGMWDRGQLSLLEVVAGVDAVPVLQVSEWVRRAPHRALLCLDAPLGWPSLLAASLAEHQAGDPLTQPADELFRRYTDACCQKRVGQRPMEVGADRIARTARAALELLEGVRERTGLPIPLAWNPDHLLHASAIETYPAATLKVRGLSNRGYKRGLGARAARERLLVALAGAWDIACDRAALLGNDDLFDAALCALTGADFLAGRCCPPPPEAIDAVHREGWIWVREGAKEGTDDGGA